jgi:hypothetical protein
MKSISTALRSKEAIINLSLDTFALAFILFMPAIAHLISFPIYMIEPMRLMLIISLAHGTKNNSYFLALSLPLFSFLVSGHPFFFKMLIITGELTLNVLLFYVLRSRIKNIFVSLFSAIIISKLACYLAYLVFFSRAFVLEESSLSFILVQLATTLVFSAYVYYFEKRQA